MATPIDLANIQGDILFGLPKQTQLFYFFRILDANNFRSRLPTLLPLITTAKQTQDDRSEIRKFKAEVRLRTTDGDGEAPHPATLAVAGVNIAFSASGLSKLSVDDNLSDPVFTNGMKKDASNLGDNGTGDGNNFTPDWDATFLAEIHGVILVTGDCHDTVENKLTEVQNILGEKDGSSIEKVGILPGDVRPEPNRGHEHFGYKDGISQPALKGIDTSLPGQPEAQPGVILLGREGDPRLANRPSWAVDGSFLTFRKLPQLVPEFDRFLKENALPIIDPSADTANLLGARLVGRWKSGAPVVKALLRDDPELGKDPQQNNDFKEFGKNSQDACPFAAHIRKMVPRGDIGADAVSQHLIARRGIPFGPEVTYEEEAQCKTKYERGLYFVCYQSDIGTGFQFLQRAWANSPQFPFPQVPEVPGPDAIIGQSTGAGVRTISGHVPGDAAKTLDLNIQWVNSKGGEYFFSPSLSALKGVFAAAA